MLVRNQSQAQSISEMQEHDERLDLLCEVGKKVGSVSRLAKLVEQITQMTQHTLRASASSVLLLDEENDELYFDIAEGEAVKA